MALVAHADKALLNRYSPHSNSNSRTQFIGEDRHRVSGQPEPGVLFPIAYLVEQGPHTTLRPHFHVADQFQVFVTGEGRIGTKQAAAGLGHFVGPYSGYGPIVGGETGLAYMTLRNAYDGGAQWLPENSASLRAQGVTRREATFEERPPSPADLAAQEGVRMTALMAQMPDGMAAWSYTLGPNASVEGPAPASGGGQFWLVMEGHMLHAQEGAMPRLSLAFVAPDEAAYTARAGDGGLHVFVLQFPVRAAAAGEAP